MAFSGVHEWSLTEEIIEALKQVAPAIDLKFDLKDEQLAGSDEQK